MSLAYLITGGAGFIGGHMSQKLLHERTVERVVVYDDLSNSDLTWPERCAADARYKFVQGDILDQRALESSLDGIDRVVHLASSVDTRAGLSDVWLDFHQCGQGTLSILQAMRRVGCRHIIFSSSSTIYGDPAKVPTSESDGPYAPISLYGAGKLAAEGLLSAFAHLFGFTCHVFRFGNVVGGGMNHGVIYDFLVKLRNDRSVLDVLGNGRQRKNYFLVEECIEGMIHCSSRLAAGFHALNLGNTGTTSVSRIASLVLAELGLHETPIRYTGGKRGWPGDVPVVEFDLSAASSLGWQARANSDESVRQAIRRMVAEMNLIG